MLLVVMQVVLMMLEGRGLCLLHCWRRVAVLRGRVVRVVVAGGTACGAASCWRSALASEPALQRDVGCFGLMLHLLMMLVMHCLVPHQHQQSLLASRAAAGRCICGSCLLAAGWKWMEGYCHTAAHLQPLL